MTYNEIIKVLECSTKQGFCETCKYREKHITDENFYWCECGKTCVNGSAWESAILDLINRQQTEIRCLIKSQKACNSLIENQKADIEILKKGWKADVIETQNIKAEAIKEFAEKLTQRFKTTEIAPLTNRKTLRVEEADARVNVILQNGVPDIINKVKKEMVGEE